MARVWRPGRSPVALTLWYVKILAAPQTGGPSVDRLRALHRTVDALATGRPVQALRLDGKDSVTLL